MKIAELDPFDPRALDLLAQSDAYHLSLYPPQSCHLLDPTELQPPLVLLLGLFGADETLLGMGGYRRCADAVDRYVEIKRLFVPETARGAGVARRLMLALEQRAAAEGFGLARLETGPLQPEALQLYRRSGYADRGPFGDYANDPLSVFMEKRL